MHNTYRGHYIYIYTFKCYKILYNIKRGKRNNNTAVAAATVPIPSATISAGSLFFILQRWWPTGHLRVNVFPHVGVKKSPRYITDRVGWFFSPHIHHWNAVWLDTSTLLSLLLWIRVFYFYISLFLFLPASPLCKNAKVRSKIAAHHDTGAHRWRTAQNRNEDDMLVSMLLIYKVYSTIPEMKEEACVINRSAIIGRQ